MSSNSGGQSERKYTGMAKLFAIEERQQKEKNAAHAAKAPENISPPVKSSPAEIFAAHEETTAPAIIPPPAPEIFSR